jgi:ribosomal protein S3
LIGVKCWIYQGENIPRRKAQSAAASAVEA